MTWPAAVTRSLLAFAAILTASATPVAAQEWLDCEDFENQAEAQAYYRANPNDPTGNDADEDGIACELFEYDDDTTDLEPATAAVGGDTTATTTASAVPATGAGGAAVEDAGGSGSPALLGLLAAAVFFASLAVRRVLGARR